uniref:Type I restriction modification DNA specificity domain-containing protein n=1 Tax=Candidatus Kentrum sp. DK TaxID=2126562 RepID=A0A450TMF0_9GAMM|nr:MAG: hypothetical protein BECKDK2373C_GA0170839_11961 [Candidatus Kentron sp. DK]
MNAVKLAECCAFFSGGTPEKSKSEYWKGEIPWFSPKDIKSFDLTSSQDRISEAAISESATRLIAPGTILVVGRMLVLRLPLLAGLFHLLSLAKIGAGEQQSPAHSDTNRSV